MKNIQGFSLIEVLVSVMILSTALLGLVGLQASGVKNVITAYNRTQASQLASSIADRIRANIADAKLGNASTYITKNPAVAQEKPNCLNATGCSAANMAENDLFYWNLALKGKSGKNDTGNSNGLEKTGTITSVDNCPISATIQFTINISWSEGRDDNKDKITDDDLTFLTIFQIPRDTC